MAGLTRNSPEVRARLPGERVLFGQSQPMPLDCGVALGPFTVAYRTYGRLNADRSNAILVCHALTGDQFLAETHPITGKSGWWSNMVGPGLPLDTDRYFVLCANVLGGCMGTTGPSDPDPISGKPYGLHFPVVTVGDMVRAQKLLIDHLGIDKLFCVIGGSMGGMQVPAGMVSMWLWIALGAVVGIALVWIVVTRSTQPKRRATAKPAAPTVHAAPYTPKPTPRKTPSWQPTAPFIDSHPPAVALDHAFAETTFDDEMVEPLERPTGFADTRVLGEDDDVTARLSADRLDACFDLTHATANAARAVDAL